MKKLIFILLFIPALLTGATLYVDESGIDDAGRNGSIAQPFASFHYAVTRAVAGDVIYFNAGEYTETVQIALPVQISIDGAGRDLVTIYITANYRPFILMQSNAEGTNGNQSIKNITIDGTNTCEALIHIFARSNVLIENCRLINATHEGVYFYGLIDRGERVPTIYSANNVVRNNIIYNCCGFGKMHGGWNTNHYGIALGAQKDMIIEHNTIIQPEREGPVGVPIGFANHGHHCGLKIRYNHLETAGKKGSSSTIYGWFFALELWSPRGGNEIHDNRIIGDIDIGGYNTNDDEGYGFALKIYRNDCRVPESTPAPYKYTYRGVRLESGMKDGVYIYQNQFANQYTGVSFDMARKATAELPVMLVKDVYIFLNTFTQIEKSDTTNNYGFLFSFLSEGKIQDHPTLPDDLRDAVVRDVYIWRNTIYNSAFGGGKGTYAMIQCNDGESIFRNIRAIGNICYNVYQPVRLFDVTSVDSIFVNYNIFHGAGSTLYHFGDMNPETVTTTGNVTSNPLFMDAAEGNFELQSGSPAINAILAGVDIAYDFRGWPIVGLPDAGAYEYGATAPAVGGMLIDASGVLLRSVEGTLMRFEGVVEGVDTPEPDPDPEPEEPEEPEVFQRLGVAAQSVDHGSEEMFVKVDLCSDVEWVATSSEEWLKVGTQRYWKVASGAYVTFLYSGLAVDIGAFEYLDVMVAGHDSAFLYLIAEENTGEERTAIVTITSDEVEGVSQIAVTQAAGAIVSREGILERRLYVNRHTRELVVRNE